MIYNHKFIIINFKTMILILKNAETPSPPNNFWQENAVPSNKTFQPITFFIPGPEEDHLYPS